MATAALASGVPQLIHERFLIEPLIGATQARSQGLLLDLAHPFGQALVWFVACRRLWRALVFHGQSVAQCSMILKIKATNGVMRKPKVTRVASNERSDGRIAVIRCEAEQAHTMQKNRFSYGEYTIFIDGFIIFYALQDSYAAALTFSKREKSADLRPVFSTIS